MLWEAGLPLRTHHPRDKVPHWILWFIFSLDSERALDLPIPANFNLPPPLLSDGLWWENVRGFFLLSCFCCVGRLLSLTFSALMGLSPVTWHSAPPWWSDVEIPIDLSWTIRGTSGASYRLSFSPLQANRFNHLCFLLPKTKGFIRFKRFNHHKSSP